MHTIAEVGNYEIYHQLAEQQEFPLLVNLQKSDQYGSTPLHKAVENGHYKMAYMILEKISRIERVKHIKSATDAGRSVRSLVTPPKINNPKKVEINQLRRLLNYIIDNDGEMPTYRRLHISNFFCEATADPLKPRRASEIEPLGEPEEEQHHPIIKKTH